MLHASVPAVRATRRSAAVGRWRGTAGRSALRFLLVLALAGLASGGMHKVHLGKHEAASRRHRREAAGENLEEATGGMCHYLEDAPFVEYFECVPCVMGVECSLLAPHALTPAPPALRPAAARS